MGKTSRRRRDADVHGIAVIDKRAGMTSHDVVGVVRRTLSTSRVGHSGTLDPDATGVLVVGVGHFTRVLPYLSHLPKCYTGWVEFGSATDSLDSTGEVVAEADMSALTADDVAAALGAFRGEIEQVAPMVSARRVGGERLYEKARRGESVEREARPVTIHRFELVAFEPGASPRAFVEVECSTGTYIRSLAADLGEALGGVAHLSGLRRQRIGDYSVDNACAAEEVRLLDNRVALGPLCPIVGDEQLVTDVRHGRRPAAPSGAAADSGPRAILDGNDALVAIVEICSGVVNPRMVVAH